MTNTHKSIHGKNSPLSRESNRDWVPVEEYEQLQKALSAVCIGIAVFALIYLGVQLYKGFAFGQW